MVALGTSTRLLVERARWIRCVMTRSIASAGVSCGKGNTAFNNSRTLAVDSAGKTSTSSWCASAGSRVYICAQTNFVWATNHNAAAVSARGCSQARYLWAWNASQPISVLASSQVRSVNERQQRHAIRQA